jgi:hypothetical protein
VEDYNAGHVNRDTGCTPVERLEPSVARTLEDGADDVFCPPKAGAQGGEGPHLHPERSDLYSAAGALPSGLQGATAHPPGRADSGLARRESSCGAAARGQRPAARRAPHGRAGTRGHSTCNTKGDILAATLHATR